jgi:hypothetical protein
MPDTPTTALALVQPLGTETYDLATWTGNQTTIDQLLANKGSDISSANSLTLPTDGWAFDITGTTTINSISARNAGLAILFRFDGALQLTHNSTSLDLPGGANITTVAGDIAQFISEGSGNWRCFSYMRNAGTPIALASGSVATATIAADAVTGAKIADDALDSEHYTDGSIDAAHLASSSVTTVKINADAVTGAKIADDALDSEHYTDGSIDAAHLASSSVTTAKINADAVTSAKIVDDAIDSEHYTDGSIDAAHLAAGSLSAAKFATAGMPYCLVRNDAATSIANATETVLSWNTDVQDPDTSHDPSSNPSRITPGVAGQYVCFCSGSWASNATGVRTLYFRRNGSGSDRAWGHIINPTDGDSTIFSNFSGETLTSNGSSDYFEVVVAQSSGGSLDFATDSNAQSPFFGVIWVGPAAS